MRVARLSGGALRSPFCSVARLARSGFEIELELGYGQRQPFVSIAQSDLASLGVARLGLAARDCTH